ncbi:MAG: hypothetical protein JNM61_05485 [Zoogloeaceae bacterium]|nr:hypothetical protein [Zoogloeaceae bacterium]
MRFPIPRYYDLPSASLSSVAVATALALCSLGAGAAGKTYTLDADFDQGVLDNVNHLAPGSDQLQINAVGVGLPMIWIANHNEDSVSKFDTVNNKEVARYKTYQGNPGQTQGGNPSRIAIDVDGNAYVLNREPGTGNQPLLMKILLEGGIDRNNNGTIETSRDINNNGRISTVLADGEMFAMTSNTIAGVQDERVAWVRDVGALGDSFGRAVCYSNDGNLWVGLWNSARLYKVSSADGSTLAGPFSTSAQGFNPYGCTVDRDGIVWIATLGSGLGKFDPSTSTMSRFLSGNSDYGIALGLENNEKRVYQANTSGRTFTKFNPATNTFSTPAALFYTAVGVAVDGAGDVIVPNYGSGGVKKFHPDGSLVWSVPQQPGTTTQYGVMLDGNNDIWVMHLSSNNIAKYRGTDGAALGVYPVGSYPYVYTDGSGLTSRNITSKTGSWSVTYDSGTAGTPWGKVSWNDLVPTGASVEVKVRTADLVANLPLQTYETVTKGGTFTKQGRYIQVQARLTGNNGNESPVLYDLSIASTIVACDVDTNGSIDKNDISLIMAARGQAAQTGDPRDADGDGVITVNDARACTLQCTKPKCAP